ncbi:MAG: serine protease [Thermomicrobiales bacterium]
MLALAAVASTPAAAQKPPPLGAPEPAPSGKPPPLGAPEAARPPAARAPSPGAARPGDGERATASGTGFLVADGRVLTNHHVIDGCARVTARATDGRQDAARVDASDPRRDLALLTVPSGLGPALTFRDSPPVLRGESVVTYGFPLAGLLSSGPTLTTGTVSALAGLRDNPLHLQISAPVQPGNSGGPLLDGQGHVIGVVVSKLNAARVARMTGGDIPQNVNFAIKGTEALAFLAAQGVRPALAASQGAELRPAEIGATADPGIVLLQCFR